MSEPKQAILPGIYRQRLPYKRTISAVVNHKGVLDVDTVKGCASGMRAYPVKGCYGVCYAAATAKRYGRDFSVSVSRKPGRSSWNNVWQQVHNHGSSWYRIGTAGDPSEDWENTITVCEMLKNTGKRPVIVTKHWHPLSGGDLLRLRGVRAVINTSISALDTPGELSHRLLQLNRAKDAGLRSVARVVTCKFGATDWGRERFGLQTELLKLPGYIDNPLRVGPNDQRVMAGHIMTEPVRDAVGGGKWVSLHSKSVYLGTCDRCPDQCGTGGGI